MVPRLSLRPLGARRFLALALLPLVGGCALRGAGSPSPVALDNESALEGIGPGEAPDAPPDAFAGASVLLVEGRALFVAGRHEEAAGAFEAYLLFGREAGHRAEAAWNLALLHLLPASPVRSPSRAMALLEGIVEQHPGSVEALQARWVQGLLDENTRQRTTLQEQARSLRELNELVEQLKRIDLNRRPPGGGGSSPPPPRP